MLTTVGRGRNDPKTVPRLETLGGLDGFGEDCKRITPFCRSKLCDKARLRLLPQRYAFAQGLNSIVRQPKHAAPLAVGRSGFYKPVFVQDGQVPGQGGAIDDQFLRERRETDWLVQVHGQERDELRRAQPRGLQGLVKKLRDGARGLTEIEAGAGACSLSA